MVDFTIVGYYHPISFGYVGFSVVVSAIKHEFYLFPLITIGVVENRIGYEIRICGLVETDIAGDVGRVDMRKAGCDLRKAINSL